MSELCGKMNTYMARYIVCYKLLKCSWNHEYFGLHINFARDPEYS